MSTGTIIDTLREIDAALDAGLSVTSSVLPAGAATAANQTTGNSSLSSIDTKFPSKVGGVLPTVPHGALGTGLGIYSSVPIKYEDFGSDGFGNSQAALWVYDKGGTRNSTSSSWSFTSASFPDSLPQSGGSVVFIDVSGTWTGSLTVQALLSANTPNLPLRQAGTGTIVSSITSNGLYILEADLTTSNQITPSVSTGTADVFAYAAAWAQTGTRAQQAGTWSVGLSSGTNNIGDVDVLTLPTLPAGTNRIGSVRLVDSADADLTTTKGAQSSRAVGVQDLKDAGRTHVNYYAIAQAAGTSGTETAITLTKSSGTSATTTGASFVITSGKRFRITAFSVATRGHNTATAQTTTFNLRINTAGAVTTSSTPVLLSTRSATPATANSWDRVIIPIPDGFEIAGDGTLQFGITAAATYTTNAPTWDVTVIGYEY